MAYKIPGQGRSPVLTFLLSAHGLRLSVRTRASTSPPRGSRSSGFACWSPTDPGCLPAARRWNGYGTMKHALTIGVALAALITLTACGADHPEALPDDTTFRSCLTRADVPPKSLDTFDARRKAFAVPGPWDCVLALGSAGDRHDALEGVFATDGTALRKALTSWVDVQERDGQAVADDLGKLLAAAEEPVPDHGDDAVLRAQEDDIFADRLALIIYLGADGTPPGYDAYLARPDMSGRSDAQNRFFQNLMDKGGDAADRLRAYSNDIRKARADARHQ